MKNAIITGIYGQDGSFLCEKLIKEGYCVYGISKRKLSQNAQRIKEELECGKMFPRILNIDIYDYEQTFNMVNRIKPDEIYHLAAYHVSAEGKGNGARIREQELYNKNILATANILEASLACASDIKVLTAGSCLMFDASDTIVQTENTEFQSGSLYGLAKIAENALVDYYRKRGLYACTAILYNHESHRRASGFVTKKIVENMVKIKRKEITSFTLGNVNTEKDWGYAGDYVNAMYKMLQADAPKDYIISSEELHTILEFVTMCGTYLGLDNVNHMIEIDQNLIGRKVKGRLQGDASLIRKELNWKRKVSFENLVKEMVDYELRQY